MGGENSREMPRYKCHKEVHALKIARAAIQPNDSVDLFFEPHDPAVPGEALSPINVELPAAKRFDNIDEKDWGYYVVYEDGYISWSPTEAFENGYTRI